MLNRRTDILLTMLMVLTTLTGCKDYDDPIDGNEAKGVSLAFNVSTIRGATRMSEAITQQPGQVYRGIKDLKIFPFNIDALDAKGAIDADKTSLPGMDYDMEQNEDVKTNYFDNHTVKIPEGTVSFLCYARAVPQGESKFVNGSIMATGLTYTPNTSTISFAPEVIHTSVDIDTKASKIADYLTEIANTIKTAGNDALFQAFINKGHPVACSSTNVAQLKAWAQTQLAAWAQTQENITHDITLPEIPNDIAGYPTDIYLPDGAAVVMWQKPQGENEYRFVPQPVTTPEANINRLDRFIYPAELWYYANSRIKTSAMSQIDNFGKSWDVVLAGYEEDNGVVDASVHSVAIKNPLSYAVGCLQVGLVVSNTLTDADDKPLTLSPSTAASDETPAIVGTFPLTAVFVSGQYEQAFDFTPNSSINEYIIYDKYDKEITGITMGDAKTSTPSTTSLTKYTNTLVFQTQNDKSVRFALEFENNSDDSFMGYNGIVLAGTKFYLVGTIDVPVGQTDDYKKRAFTKNYITKGTVSINSLKQTYTYLPDLLDPRLEIAIKLTPDWILSTPTNVPL